jgi:uncharacterized membrane protein YcaP (DUF421 family)
MEDILFSGWDKILKVLIMSVSGYIAVVILLRVSGKRTLSKMNAFDFVVTVALGSVLASTALSSSIAVSEGVTCMAILIFLQYIITFISYRSKSFKDIITSSPVLLFADGRFMEDNMKKSRVRKDEVYSRLRHNNLENMDEVDFIVMETTGDMHVIHGLDKTKNLSLLNDVK